MLKPNTILFIVRWIFPALISVLAFDIIFIKNIIVNLSDIDWSKAFYELGVTSGAAAFCGLAYSIYRPSLRTLGKLGDLLTGVVMLLVYLIAATELTFYLFEDSFGRDNYAYLIGFAVIVGILLGLNSRFTNLENEILGDLMNEIRRQKNQ